MDVIHSTVPVLPLFLADLLPDATDTATPATSAAVTAFVYENTRATHPGLLRVLLNDFDRRVAAGESRHEAAVALTAQAAREAAAGLYSARAAFDALGERFVEAATHDSATGKTRTPAEARGEYAAEVSWAVGQAALDDPAERRRAVLDRLTPLPDEPPPDDSGVPLDERDTPHDPSASTTAAPTPERPNTVDDQQPTTRRVILTSAATIKPRRVRWLWEGRLALGTLGLLAGPEGLGKSSIAYSLSADVTRGTLPGEDYGRPRSVLICATEDSWEHTIVPRLIAAGADLERVYCIEVVTSDELHVGLSLPRDLTATERAARAVDASLLILDPLMSRLDGGLDSHKDAEVRRALEPLTKLADRAGLAVLGLIHHNKSGGSDPLNSVMASKAFTAVARSVHTVIRDPDDDTETRRLFGTPKNNLGRTDLPTLTFTVEGYAVPTDDGPAWTGRVVWGGEAAGTIREAMSRTEAPEDRSATAEAADWLHDYLVSQGGEAAKADVEKAARPAGHHPEALRRARQRLRLEYRRHGFPSVTVWALPTSSEGTSHVTPTRGDSTTDMTDTTEADQGERGENAPASRVSRVSRVTSGATTASGTTSAPRRPLDPALSDVDLAAALGDPCSSCSHRVGHRADCTATRTAA